MDASDRGALGLKRIFAAAIASGVILVAPIPARAHPYGQKPVASIERAGTTVQIVWTIEKDDGRILAQHLGLGVYEPVEALRHQRFAQYWGARSSVVSGAEPCEGTIVSVASVLAGFAVRSSYECARVVERATVTITALHDVDPAYSTVYQAPVSDGTARGVMTSASPSVTLLFAGDQPAPVATGSPSGRREDRILAMLQGDGRAVSLWLALMLAFALGALHAITPGHGKTITAAYIVGVGGTMKHALTLGGVVAGTHAGAVIVLGAVAAASGAFLPAQAAPWIHIAGGVLVIALGVQLFRSKPAVHRHDHDAMPVGRLAAVGFVGGLIPSPEAIAIALLAFSVGRWATGMLLVVAFSVGLAAVVLGVATLAVHGGQIARRMSSGRLARHANAAAAVVFCVMGAIVIARGIRGL